MSMKELFSARFLYFFSSWVSLTRFGVYNIYRVWCVLPMPKPGLRKKIIVGGRGELFFAAYLKMCHFRTQIMFAHSSGGNGPVSDRKSLVLEGFLRIDYSRVVRDFGGSPYERNSKRRPVAAGGRHRSPFGMSLIWASSKIAVDPTIINWQKTPQN